MAASLRRVTASAVLAAVAAVSGLQGAPATALDRAGLERRAVAAFHAVEVSAAAAKKKASSVATKVKATTTTAVDILGGSPTTTLAPLPTGTGGVGVEAIGHYAVDVRSQTFVDTSRTTPAHGSSPALPTRTLVTTILVPRGAPVGTTFPVLVFGHGLGATPKDYLDLLRPVASAGYIVAMPTFPLSNHDTPGGPTVLDEPEQAGDMRFALDQVVALGAQAGSPLAGIVDGSRLAAAGHSLGGITTLDYAYSSSADTRLKAAIPMSSILNFLSGSRYFTKPMIPMLLIHGDADETVPYSLGSVATFSAAPAPKALLTIRNGTHSFSLQGVPNSTVTVGTAVVSATVDFLDRYVKGDPGGLNRLQALAVAQPSLLRLDAQGLH